MGEIIRLGWAERPFIQTEILALLQREVGQRSSQDMIERAALELSDRLWLIEQAVFEDRVEDVGRLATSMIKIARQIGLTDLAQVAGDLAECCGFENYGAIAPVAARLQRTGEASLQYAVHYQQMAR